MQQKNFSVLLKKVRVNRYNLLENSVPLQRFNKQLIVLQIKKAKKMKKIAFMFVAVAAIAFASCDGNKTAEGTTTDSIADTTVVTDTTAADSVAADSVEAPAADSVAADSVEAPAADSTAA